MFGEREFFSCFREFLGFEELSFKINEMSDFIVDLFLKFLYKDVF